MKVIRATFNKPVYNLIKVDLPKDELISARIIQEARKNAVYALRKELEKLMVSLTEDDITFKLEDTE